MAHKVGLMVRLNGMWQGGVNYYNSLIACFAKYGSDNIELNVFTDMPDRLQRFSSERVRIHKTDLLAGRETFRGALGRATERFYGVNFLQLKLMERNGIELISHNGVGQQKVIPTLPWFADFQHKHYPDFFSKKELAERDLFINKTKFLGNLLLSSRAAENDFRTYFPSLTSVRTQVLHFTSSDILDVAPLPLPELRKKYSIRDRFFYVPNQFWRHKNHDVIVEALRIAPDFVQVVCSGKEEDYRHPHHVPTLIDKVKRYELSERFISLGSIPYRDVVSLMHHSLAIINPSLFEGWSTSVEEAKAMHKQIVLSDIAVHREQNPARGFFFNPHAPNELSHALCEIYNTGAEECEHSNAALRLAGRAETEKKFAAEYSGILLKLCGAH